MEKTNLKKVYREICYGYSPFSIGGRELYFKHITTFDKIKCDEFGELAFDRAKRLGKKEEKDILSDCLKDGTWTDSEEKRIESYKEDIRVMSKRKIESFDEEQIEQIEEILKEYNHGLNELLVKKLDLLKNSAESYSNHEYLINYIIESVYTDKELKTQLWSDEEKLYLNFGSISTYYHIYNSVFDRFSDKNIKRICISNYFQSPYSIVSDPISFFNISPYSLTEFQIKLLRYGKYFKDILTESYDIPEEDSDDPDKLEQWFILKRNKISNPDYDKKKKTGESVRSLFSLNQ